MLLVPSLKASTAITWLFKPGMSRQVKQEEMWPEDLHAVESWYNKMTGIVIQKEGNCPVKINREKGRGRDM